jgi:hypothetical protein
MKYTLGFYVDHTRKGIKGYYLISDDGEKEYFADPTEVMHNIYR